MRVLIRMASIPFGLTAAIAMASLTPQQASAFKFTYKLNSFGPEAEVSPNGQLVKLEGIGRVHEATPGMTSKVLVLVMQASTGATGTAFINKVPQVQVKPGDPVPDISSSRVIVRGLPKSARFKPGPAQATGMGVEFYGGIPISFWTWTADVTLHP